MSKLHDIDPDGPVENIIVPRLHDLGDGFTVRRALPAAGRRMVGPFIFLDQMGPAELAPGRGIDVRPHPHIGLATVTYLFDGEIRHRDSLGSALDIEPGAVNWMTAGRGIAHSERSGDEWRARGGLLAGLQLWVALPSKFEETDPAFHHTDAATCR
jgi:redox-sensitive bicupin YhaK (pirin superfamily)